MRSSAAPAAIVVTRDWRPRRLPHTSSARSGDEEVNGLRSVTTASSPSEYVACLSVGVIASCRYAVSGAAAHAAVDLPSLVAVHTVADTIGAPPTSSAAWPKPAGIDVHAASTCVPTAGSESGKPEVRAPPAAEARVMGSPMRREASGSAVGAPFVR